MSGNPAQDIAETFVELHDAMPTEPPLWAHALNVAGEAGEFVEAYRRWTGHARRPGTWGDVKDELADVVISAHVFALRAGFDLAAAVKRKGAVVLARGVGEDVA